MLSHVDYRIKLEMPVVLTYIDQKRVELARALMADPKVLLLDEWLAGLNPSEMKIGISLIRDLGTKVVQLSLLNITWTLSGLCDRCVVMNSGVKIAEGDPQAVLMSQEVIRAYLGGECLR